MGGSSGSGSGEGQPGDSVTTIRYPPYVEEHHAAFLDIVAEKRDLLIDDSPFVDWTDLTYLEGFFGSGYTIASFPSLYDMYGKFMAGLDVEVLFTQVLDDSINNTAIDDRVSAHAVQLSDDIIQNAHPRFVTGMRDINSVVASSFVIGKALMETARTKSLSLYDSELRVRMLPVAVQRYGIHLNWNAQTIGTYVQMLQLYLASMLDVTARNYEMAAKDKLWPFTVLDYNRAALGALTGAHTANTDVEGSSGSGPSQLQRALGGAMMGAAAGFQVGGPWGAAIGGFLGGATAFL